MKRGLMGIRLLTALVCSIFLIGSAGYAVAGSLAVPNDFVSGNTASASQVNSNFTAVETAVNDNNSRIGSLEGKLTAVKETTSQTWNSMATTATAERSISFLAAHTGYVIVFASGTVIYNHKSGSSESLCLDLDDTAAYTGGCTPYAGSKSAYRHLINSTLASFVDKSESFSLIETFPVTKGQFYNFYLNGYASGFSSTVYLFHPTLTVLFVPNAL